MRPSAMHSPWQQLSSNKPITVTGVLVCLSLLLTGCPYGGESRRGGKKSGQGDGSGNYVDYSVKGLKGFSWGPLYLHDESCIETFKGGTCDKPFPDSDVAASWGSAFWIGTQAGGRGDMKNMHDLGANTVRLYGNNPKRSKSDFLDYARALNMQVAVGITGYIYNELGGPNCAKQEKREQNCFDAAKGFYSKSLGSGGFQEGDYYHNAISIINLANEPDFFGAAGSSSGKGANYLYAMVAAFDAVLQAEKDAGIKPWKTGSALPMITATWSQALQALGEDVCSAKYGIVDKKAECLPGIIFMVQFRRAVEDPENLVGYVPKNDIKEAYKKRWINCVQVFQSVAEVEKQLLVPYSNLKIIKDVPLALTEWHDQPSIAGPLTDELQKLESARKTYSFFLGASFFQYQVAYQKGDEERAYGLFGLGHEVVAHTGKLLDTDPPLDQQPVNCLKKAKEEYLAAFKTVWNGEEPSEGFCVTEQTDTQQQDQQQDDVMVAPEAFDSGGATRQTFAVPI